MYLLTLTGMVSSRCERHLSRILKTADHKAKFEIKLEQEMIHIESSLELQKIKRLIEQEGYKVIHSEERP
jgi:cation transport ATPase